jgi:hypothetical protein
MTVARFGLVADMLTERRRPNARLRRLDTPGKPLGSIPLFRFTFG